MSKSRPVTREHVQLISREAKCLQKPQRRVTICVIVRNRVKLTIEWIQWHRILGVQYFYIYDDGSDEGLKEALRPFVEEGVVQYHRAPLPPYSFNRVPTDDAQTHVSWDCLQREKWKDIALGNHSRSWVGITDNDEFLVIPTGECLPDIIADIESKRSDFGAL